MGKYVQKIFWGSNFPKIMVLFQPKYRLGHPDYLCFLPGSKYPTNISFNFENRHTVYNVLSELFYFASTGICVQTDWTLSLHPSLTSPMLATHWCGTSTDIWVEDVVQICWLAVGFHSEYERKLQPMENSTGMLHGCTQWFCHNIKYFFFWYFDLIHTYFFMTKINGFRVP